MKSLDWWRELCSHIDAKDSRAFVAYLTPDAEFRFANGPSAVGHAAIGAAVDGFWASIRGSQHRILRVWGDESTSVCEGLCTYTRLDGSTVTIPFVDVLYFREGLAEKYYIYMDAAPLWAQS